MSPTTMYNVNKKWVGDRGDYLPWLAGNLFPDDSEKQAQISWAVHAGFLELTYDSRRDADLIRAHLARGFKE